MKAGMHKAFTLIELSIVLVIIGLIVGGVLVGRDLIRAADIRKQIRQIQDYQTAFNTFYMKYGCIPGDCPNATTQLGSTDSFGNAVTNGNGDGVIDSGSQTSYNATPYNWGTNPEIYGALQQLAMAKLIPFAPPNPATGTLNTGIPPIAMSPNAGFFLAASYNFVLGGGKPDLTNYQNGTNALWFTGCAISNSTTMNTWDDNCAIFKAADLQAMDQKIDDGKPLSGKLISYGGYNSINNCLQYVGASVQNAYDLTYTSPQCQFTYVIN